LRLKELRVGWGVLGVLLALVLLDRPSVRWSVASVAPWLTGALVLIPPRRGNLAASTLTQACGRGGALTALIILLAFLFLVVYLFSPAAGLSLALWGEAALLVLAASARADLAGEFLLGGAVTAVALTLALGGAEIAFRSHWLAHRYGSPQEQAAWERGYDKLWKQNLFGFRSRYETIARRTGVARVLAVGDSYTWGDKIAKTDSTWPARLERALEQAYPGSRFEVINTGQRGWSTANEAEFLRRLGWQFDPDLVVVQFDRNDVLQSTPNFASQSEDAVYPQVHLLPDRFRTGPVRSSAFLAFLEGSCSGLLHPESMSGTEWSVLYRDGSPGWNQMQAALQEIGDSARLRKVPVVMVLFPTFFPGVWTPVSYPLREVHQKVAGRAGQAGIHVLDLTPALSAEGGDWRRWDAAPYDGHPSSAAHALTSRVLTDYIVRNGWLAPRPRSP
jgi:lysophospholipase L1-like esterase